jgi:hypothetical protein
MTVQRLTEAIHDKVVLARPATGRWASVGAADVRVNARAVRIFSRDENKQYSSG